MRFKVIAKHITGLNVPWFGLQWTPPVDQIRLAESVLDCLANRGIFYEDFNVEVEHACMMSAEELNAELLTWLHQCPSETPVKKQVQEILRATKYFISQMRKGIVGVEIVDKAFFYEALGRLRKRVGIAVASLSAAYGLDVNDELAGLIPFNNK